MITHCTRCKETLESGDSVVEIKTVRRVIPGLVNLGLIAGYMHSECMRLGYNIDQEINASKI